MLTREAIGTIYTHAGPEIGVASTKAFTGQLTALLLTRAVSRPGARQAARPTHVAETDAGTHAHAAQDRNDSSARRPRIEELRRQLFPRTPTFSILGRGIHYPIALEGALKLKEISYIHAEGYPAGEMKHGPNALIDENLPVVVIATRDESDPASMILLRKNDFEHAGSEGARRHRDRASSPRATRSLAKPPTT